MGALVTKCRCLESKTSVLKCRAGDPSCGNSNSRGGGGGRSNNSEKHYCVCNIYLDSMICRSKIHVCTCLYPVALCKKHMNYIQSIEAVEDCAICLDKVTVGVQLSGCKHYYHLGCIKKWLNYRSLCPLCQRCIPVV